MKRFALSLILVCACLAMNGAGWLNGPRFGPGLGPGFAPAVRVVSPAGDVRVAWNADPDCVFFDTVDDIASTSIIGLASGSQNRTWMYWVKDEEPANTSRVHHFAMGINSSLADWGFFSENGKFVANIGWPKFISATQAREDVWKNYAMVSTNGTMGGVKFYFNGIETSGYTYAGNATDVLNTASYVNYPGISVFLGRRTDGVFAGDQRKMAEFAIFNEALTAEQIQEYMPHRFRGDEPGLVRLYHMDEGTGTICIDSKSGYNMDLVGATWTTK